jgi:iron complex transport system substrate-binding protein
VHITTDRSRHAIRALVGTLTVAAVLSACTAVVTSPSPTPSSSISPTSAPAATFPVTLTDDEGAQITIPSEPSRIVSLTPAATEILFAIGAGDRVVAKVEDITPWPPEADDLPVVATFQGVELERIVDLDPDLVIAGGVGFTDPDAVAQLRRLRIPVVVVYADSTGGALHDIELIGDAAGAGAAARDLTASMRAAFDQVEAATAGLSKPKVFYEIDATSKIYTPAEGSVYAEMLALAGSDPLLTDSSYEISLEEIVDFDPEIILLGSPFTTPDQVRQRPGWGGIAAVRNGTIIPVNDSIITRPGPRLVDGLRELARAIHPDVDLPVATPAPSAAAAAALPARGG